MYLNFSALETALLPYFLFIVYAAILLWVRSVRATDEISPAAEQTDFVISVPNPTPADSLAGEFERELVNRVVVPVARKRRSVSDLIVGEFQRDE